MNRKQKAEIVEIIKNDCYAREEYINDDGKTCAIGALALEAGINYNLLAAYKDQRVDGITLLLETLSSRFGLTYSEIDSIQRLNDAYETSEARREAILSLLEKIPVTELELQPA